MPGGPQALQQPSPRSPFSTQGRCSVLPVKTGPLNIHCDTGCLQGRQVPREESSVLTSEIWPSPWGTGGCTVEGAILCTGGTARFCVPQKRLLSTSGHLRKPRPRQRAPVSRGPEGLRPIVGFFCSSNAVCHPHPCARLFLHLESPCPPNGCPGHQEASVQTPPPRPLGMREAVSRGTPDAPTCPIVPLAFV